MIWTIISVVMFIGCGLLLYLVYGYFIAFGEIIVRFVEQNQKYYESQKHLVEKSSNIILDLKKLTTQLNDLKKTTSRLQDAVKKSNIKKSEE